MIKNYDYLVKTLLIGDSHVGKSSIILQFLEERCDDTYSCTIGVDFKSVIMDIKDKLVKILLWDTAGQERFKFDDFPSCL